MTTGSFPWLPSRACSIRALALAALVCAPALVQADGIVLLKPYNTSPANEIAEARIFKSFVDRTAILDFEWRNGQREDFDKARIARMIPIPTPSEYPTFDDATVAGLEDKIKAIQKVAQQFPKIAAPLAPSLEALNKEIGLFKQGHKKLQGEWFSPAEFKRQQVAAMEAAAAQEMIIRTDALMNAFASSSANLEHSLEIIDQLRKVAPPPPKTQALLARWDKSYAEAKTLQAEAQGFLADIAQKRPSPFFTEIKTPQNIRAIPPEFIAQGKLLNAKVAAFNTSNTFPQIRPLTKSQEVSLQLIIRIAAIADKVAAADIPGAAQLTMAPKAADNVSGDGGLAFIVNTFQGCVQALSSQINSAKLHLEKGDALQKAQRTSAAIKEYEEANKVLNDPIVTELIKQLRKQTLGL